MPSASQCIVAPRSFCVLAICALTICPAHWLYCVGLSLAAGRKQSLGRKQPTGPLVVAAMPVSSSMKSRLRNGKFIQSVRSRRRSWTDFGRLADHVPPWVTGGTEGEEDDAGTGSVEASDPLGELEAMQRLCVSNLKRAKGKEKLRFWMKITECRWKLFLMWVLAF